MQFVHGCLPVEELVAERARALRDADVGCWRDMALHSHIERIEKRISAERGTLYGRGRRAAALVYPSPYPVGMASLGFQSVYRSINLLADAACERGFAPDDVREDSPILSYESRRPVADFPVIAFSVAWEPEVAGLLRCLERMGIPVLAEERDQRHPWIVAGGPLTLVNPRLLAPFVDVVVVGEAEGLVEPLWDALFGYHDKQDAMRALASLPGFLVPRLNDEMDIEPAVTRLELLPARAAVWTPESALADMFLVEAERGCARQCTFCVMRRFERATMRVVPAARVLGAIPEDAPKVGLVGAAVSDHPQIEELVSNLVQAGRGVGLSSLRADRLSPKLVRSLVAGGNRTLTIAADGASERLRAQVCKRIDEQDLVRAASLAREARMQRLKLYVMVGLPNEGEQDIEELIETTRRINAAAGNQVRTTLAVSPFVAKPRTPLAGTPFAGIRELEQRMRRLRLALEPAVEVRATSARWAWVEYVLANSGASGGHASWQAVREGAGFAAWKRALAPLLKTRSELPAERQP